MAPCPAQKSVSKKFQPQMYADARRYTEAFQSGRTTLLDFVMGVAGI
jgi:hypothetical protein